MSTDAQNRGKTPVSRTMVFLSHAGPEDNVFTRWLALQLANEGYPLWCDLTKLLGGEAFWEDIQIAYKERTAKFLFVLSRASNEKKGTLDELDCALGVSRPKKVCTRLLSSAVTTISRAEIASDRDPLRPLARQISLTFGTGCFTQIRAPASRADVV